MGAYPYLDDLKITYGDAVDSSGDFLTVSYATIPLIASISDAEQLEVVWFSPYLTDINAAQVATTDLAADDVFSSGVIPAATYVVDTGAQTITIDQDAVQAAAFITSDGQTLYRAKVTPSDSNLMTVQRSTPIGSKLVEFVPGSRITPGQLNLSDDQLFYKLQELTKQADDLFGVATVTGIIDDGIDVTLLSSLTDVVLTPLTTADALYWTGSVWTNGGIGLGTLSDVSDTLTETLGHVLTWDGTEWISAAPTGDGGVYVNSVNGASGTVVLATSDLTNDSGYLTAGTIPTDISSYTNDSGYVTAVTAPVTSVNGLTGAVVIAVPENVDDLTDVEAATPQTGQALRWNSTSQTWKPGGVNVTTPDTQPLPFIFELDPNYDQTAQHNLSIIQPVSAMHNGGAANGQILDMGVRAYNGDESLGDGRGYYPVSRITLDLPSHLLDPGVPYSTAGGTWAYVNFPLATFNAIAGLEGFNVNAIVKLSKYISLPVTMQTALPTALGYGDNTYVQNIASCDVNTGGVWADYLLRWDGVSADMATPYGVGLEWRPASDVDADTFNEYGDFMFKGPYGGFYPVNTASTDLTVSTLDAVQVLRVRGEFPAWPSGSAEVNNNAVGDPTVMTEAYWETAVPNGFETRIYPLYTEREQIYTRFVVDFLDLNVASTVTP